MARLRWGRRVGTRLCDRRHRDKAQRYWSFKRGLNSSLHMSVAA
ncbi:predicted protein [Chaetomium globosum CBS 148.51]|uniref:Uncharacterized protein n=1 Tax=Chaetomium globosum (strain ATCC 6205 / CBS 148.51 / DSM 1962 / NBRC 6347 / NRRL 1970) TaxID=306901 RepID=Q2H939_CHAGB|nr:uncharacterized protein CHGG_03265 [Chaetomium globosum CBS 148.51]EAQ91330.1 predicted protein [Chaetomium globosum CBS 148.51]